MLTLFTFTFQSDGISAISPNARVHSTVVKNNDKVSHWVSVAWQRLKGGGKCAKRREDAV